MYNLYKIGPGPFKELVISGETVDQLVTHIKNMQPGYIRLLTEGDPSTAGCFDIIAFGVIDMDQFAIEPAPQASTLPADVKHAQVYKEGQARVEPGASIAIGDLSVTNNGDQPVWVGILK